MPETFTLMHRLHEAQQAFAVAAALLDSLVRRFPWAGR